MQVKIRPFAPSGEITAPPSKSAAMRYILLSAICDGKTEIKNVGDSDDVRLALGCVKALGAGVDYDGVNATVTGIKTPAVFAAFDFGESAFLMRTIIPLAASLGVRFTFTAKGRLSSRPVESLTTALKGVLNVDRDGYFGRMTAGEYSVDGSLSSQFVSGLLIAAAAINGVTVIDVTGEIVSRGYIDATLAALETFGVKFRNEDYARITVCGGAKSPATVITDGDYSSAAYFLCLGAIKGHITVKGLNPRSVQPDRAIIDVLKEYGAEVSISENEITVRESAAKNPIVVSVKNCPDLAAPIAALAACSSSESVIKDAARLKIKESDRFDGIARVLGDAGVGCVKGDDELRIRGGAVCGGAFNPPRDHRMVALAAVLAAVAGGECESVIDRAEATSKSYTDFFKDLATVGGKGDVRLSR